MGSSRMTFFAVYTCAILAFAIEGIAVPHYVYREIKDNTETSHKTPHIPILKQTLEQSNEGYQYSYETGNGIHAEESGYIKNKGDEKNEIFVQKGSITYHDEHGHPITLTYVADEKGFRPQGEHLPITPSIPKEIMKVIEEKPGYEEQEPEKQPLEEQEQEAQKEDENSSQLKLAEREYQRQIQHQIQNHIQRQYQHQQVYSSQEENQQQQLYQPQHQYQPKYLYQRRNYQRQNY